jgi:response regulator of citrate/malate metabolism
MGSVLDSDYLSVYFSSHYFFRKKYGYELCGVAESGEKALKLIRNTVQNLVFIDIVLKIIPD